MTETTISRTDITIQVTFDAGNPHALAAFWAEALGYEIEDVSELVDQLVAAGHLPASEVVEVDGHTAFRIGAGITDPTGSRPRLLFQVVPEDKTVKSRLHLDLHVGTDRIDTEVARLTALGASLAWESDDRGAAASRCATPRATSSASSDERAARKVSHSRAWREKVRGSGPANSQPIAVATSILLTG